VACDVTDEDQVTSAIAKATERFGGVDILVNGAAQFNFKGVLNMPLEDRYLMTKEELCDTLAAILGGRAAEEIVFGEISTGAANDLQQATQMAERMVKEFGMSQRIGLVAHRTDRSQQLLGMPPADRAYSDETAKLIDAEVKAIIDAEYARAKDLLAEHRQALEDVVEILFENEVMDGDQLRNVLVENGIELPPRPKQEVPPGSPAASNGNAPQPEEEEREVP